MNKREKAIWNIAIVISTIVAISFIYSLWNTQSALSLKKKNFISTLKKFKEYGIPSSAALSSILNDNNISIQKNSTANNKEKTISNEKDFIEYREVVSKKKDLKAIEAKAPFTSIVGFAVKGNSRWDDNENFEDANNNGQWDAAEDYIDADEDGQYDFGEEFTDVDNSGDWTSAEDFTDRENKIKPGCYLLTEINGKRFKKAVCSTYDLAINDITFFNDRNPLLGFENLNNYGTISNGEEFQDAGNGQWDEGETFEDIGNGQYDEGEAFQDIGNGQYDDGETFEDINNNGQWDYVLLKNLKATKEEVEEALKSNYFYSQITDKDKKINIYIKTDKEIDEYNLKANCFECTISKLEESMNSLEISLKGQREHEFVLPETLTDPTDLSNVVILPGYEGGYNQSARRNAPRLSLIVGDGNSLNSYVSIEYKGHNYVLKEGDRLEDDGVIHKINKDNVEYKKDNEIKILTLDKK